ncbi:MAG: dihydrolipoyl dehydrogenase [Euryarchaeota archaeon RBG_19FT_COMBO_69_17]|nr:MAG: dihydrolipoyl dehydrogenase [Euryarchaeota archaeon RBG_19FT_COMBO_69_17]
MARHADVVVVGGGPGGYPAAIRAAQLGKRVLLVERHKLGGECLNYGCIPSKALIHTGNLVASIRRAGEWGVLTGPVAVDMGRLQAWKASVVDRLVGGVGQLLKGNGVEVVSGEASFVGPKALEVRTGDGTREEVSFDRAILATGGRPSDLPAFRFDGTRILSTKEALELPRIPGTMLVIGGGVSGLEIGTFYAKLGTKVVVVEILEQLLPGMDPEVVRVLGRSLKRLGIESHVKSQAKAWREADGRAVVDVETPEGSLEVLADVVLVTVGRRANTAGLGLDRAGVKADAKGQILVDRQMRTSNPDVFAVGDVVGPPFLAHKATREGLVAAEASAGRPTEVDHGALPSAIFTDPEIATVGRFEVQATASGHRVRIGKVPFAAIGRALTEGESEGFVKIVMDADSKLLLGAQIIGPRASDLISELALAIEMGATVEDVALTTHPHPTLPEGILEGAEAALGQAIHVLNR